MRNDSAKVLIIGLDGAPFSLLKQWASEGKLPNIAWMIENGVSGELTSTFPPVTSTAWASFMTGKNPGKHGIFDLLVKQKGSYDFRFGTPIDGKAIWTILNEAGKKVGCLNVPKTYPPEKVNGFIVASPRFPGAFYPTDLEKELKENINDYGASVRESYPPGMEDAFLRDLQRVTRKSAEETFHFIKNYNWDFFMTVFFDGDTVQHSFWRYMDPKHPLYDSKGTEKYGDAILNYYKMIDATVEEIFNKIDDDTTVIVVSDHGAGPIYKVVYINDWLRSLGLLKLKRGTEGGLTKGDITNRFAQRILSAFIKIVPSALFRVLAEKSYKAIYRLHPLTPVLPDIDWTQTKAYSTGGGCYCPIFINLKGREPVGMVEPGKEYEELRDYLTKELYSLKDPKTGERIVDKVFKREELYLGPHLDQAPDLTCAMRGTAIKAASRCRPEGAPLVEDSSEELATHRMNGTLIISGPLIKKNEEIRDARIIDLAPTILHMMNVPVPIDIDGRVLKEVFKPGFPLAKRKMSRQAPTEMKERRRFLSEEEEEKMKERLKGLGYLG